MPIPIKSPVKAMDLETRLKTAIKHHQAGRISEAESVYRNILSVAPDHADTLHLLGITANQRHEHLKAIELIGRAISISSQRPVAEFHNNIGTAHQALCQFDEAIDHFERAVALKPNSPEMHHNLASALAERANSEDATAHFRRALALKPGYAKAHYGLGKVLQAQGDLNTAVQHYEYALAANPNYPEAHNNLGTALAALGELDRAEKCHRQALALRPKYSKGRYNLAIVLEEQGDLDEAIAQYRHAVADAPEDATVHWNLALAHLLRGDFQDGWREYEHRWWTKGFVLRDFVQPPWAGDPLKGRTILLHAEQGRGDTIQFIRYAHLVKEQGGQVIVECQPDLLRLLEGASGIDRLVAQGETLPAFDCHAALLSLPHLFGTVLETVPANVPYLHPRLDLVDAWHHRLTFGGRNIGLVWRGSPEHRNDRRRSIPADLFAGICAVKGANWFSLQKDATPEEIAAFSGRADIRDCGPDLADWAETAALVACLDMVVTADTGVAHLAGALGKPAWVLLPFNPDWRWLLNRSDSPWYPTLRLFRQPSPGDWQSVISDVGGALKAI